MSDRLEIAETRCSAALAGTLSELIFDLFSESGLIVSAEEIPDSGENPDWMIEVIVPPGWSWGEFEPTLALACPAMPAFSLREIDADAWAHQPQPARAPVRAGRFLIHEETDTPTVPPGTIALKISAGLAFGTGHHETTSGCLIALGETLKHRQPRRALDLGCGTAILAIALAKATHMPVLASDIDPVAVNVARRNAAINGVAPLLRCIIAVGTKHREISAGAPYDLIMANILARPLMAMANDIAALLAPGATLILSGLLAGQAPRVAARYRAAGLILENRMTIKEWATLTLRAPGRPELN
jgi:ribosomal protein L11 methyltransferase